MNKRLAIHQPNYLPWPGYFLKMMLCDEFVFLDHVQFSKPSYTHRTMFSLPTGDMSFLSIPTASSANKFGINQVVSCEDDWRISHRNKLNQWLKDHPFYYDLEFLWEFYEDGNTITIADFNEETINLLAKQLKIDCPSIKSSDLALSSKGTKLIVDLVISRNADEYITGTGFLNYYDKHEWPKEITLQVIDFKSCLDHSDLSTHSIVENIARLGLVKTREILQNICISQNAKLNS